MSDNTPLPFLESSIELRSIDSYAFLFEAFKGDRVNETWDGDRCSSNDVGVILRVVTVILFDL